MPKPTHITVYSKPSGCIQCTLTKKELDKAGVDYILDDITVPENTEAAKYLGFTAAPLVMVRNEDGEEVMWAGFQPEMIKKHILEAA